MAVEFRMMEARVLYNLMHKVVGEARGPMRAQSNFLLVVDARGSKSFETGHIPGAVVPKECGTFPGTIDVSIVRYCVVYDMQSTTPYSGTEAHAMAEKLAQHRTEPVYILKGGIALFMKPYLFLHDLGNKVLYMPMEVEQMQIWPLDLYDHLVFVGCLEDPVKGGLIKGMLIRAVLLLDSSNTEGFACPGLDSSNVSRLEVADEDSVTVDMFDQVAQFIESYIKHNRRVLVVASGGQVVKGIFAMAYLILKGCTLKEAHERVIEMEVRSRPSKPALECLFQWEVLVRQRKDNSSEPVTAEPVPFDIPLPLPHV